MTRAIAAPARGELLVVVGPTASGKTELAIELCEDFDGEVIGADSVQIYRRFDVGSGKPSAAERARVPHHLVDAVEPKDPLDAARFVELADAAIADVHARGKTAVVCGGTFLWVRALLFGLAEAAPSSPELRERHRAIAEAEGRAKLHADLAAIDPTTAARLAPNDLLRVSRALEVYELTGKPLSVLHEAHGFAKERHRHRLLGVARDRDELAARILARTKAWLAAGWIEETRALLADGFGEARAMGSVGYKQIREPLDGSIARDELDEAIARATRVLTRRQRTWLRDEPVTWLPA